jgi:hypothetical protein
MIVRRIGPLSLAKMMGAVYCVLGFLIGLLITCISLVVPAFSHMPPGRGAGVFGILFGVFAVIALPIFYGLMGFIAGLISGALYNFFARVVGGIRIELEAEAGELQAPAAAPPAP